ncbi:MAG: DUF3775 domain-containing protein [Xanthobacteraceae bacterium]
MPSLTIARDKVCFLIIKGREFDVKDAVTAPDDGSDPPDDGMRSVLEDRPDDPVRQELAAFINALTIDEQLDLVALTWLGRGDGSLAEWAELRETAANEHSRRTASYLLGNPMLPDHLAEGLAEFGHTCEEFAAEHFRV